MLVEKIWANQSCKKSCLCIKSVMLLYQFPWKNTREDEHYSIIVILDIWHTLFNIIQASQARRIKLKAYTMYRI